MQPCWKMTQSQVFLVNFVVFFITLTYLSSTNCSGWSNCNSKSLHFELKFGEPFGKLQSFLTEWNQILHFIFTKRNITKLKKCKTGKFIIWNSFRPSPKWIMTYLTLIKCDALRDLVPFLQFKKRQHPWKNVTFRKVAGLRL